MSDHIEFGPALRGLRRTLGLSQLALANRLGSTQRHISFLETGRSAVTSEFVTRLCTDLTLSTAQRGALFEASGLRNPFPRRALSDHETTTALDTIEQRILRNWPFPAFALDRDWTVLRANTGARTLFKGFGIDLEGDQKNLLTVMLSPEFRAAIRNWDEVCPSFYFRLLSAGERDASVAEAFAKARASGFFDTVHKQINGRSENAPLASGAELKLPGGQVLRMMPFIGTLATLQDVRLEQIEIELMVPLDDFSEQSLRSVSAPR